MIARSRPTAPLALLLALVVVACDPAVEAGAVTPRPGPGGILTDCAHIGGHDLSELQTDASQSSVVFRGVCLGPAHLHRCLDVVKISGGRLVGSDGEGTYAGADFVGSRWTLDVDTPDPKTGEGDGAFDSSLVLVLGGRRLVSSPSGPLELVDFKIDRASVSGPLKASLPAGSGSLPLCEADPARDGSTEAALFGDLHVDPDDASFSARPGALHVSCTSAATGKAALLGYRPEAIGLAAFEAVIRAIRADYCGDGDAYASASDPVLFADIKGIQGSVGSVGAVREARWGRDGALCLGEARGLGVDAAALRDACGIPLCAAGPLGSQGEWLATSLTGS